MIMRCIAVDDEPLALEKIAGYISVVPFLTLMGKFGKPMEALDYLHHHEVDLIFLDIQMDLLTGIQLLEVLRKKPFVVVTTAYDQYALKGYELDVTDYLLKPFNFERFLKAVDKVYSLYSERKPTFDFRKENDIVCENMLFIKNGYQVEKIDPDEIFFIEGMREYLGIHLQNRKILTLLTFQKLEEKLPPGQFIRIHRSYLVSVSKIQSIRAHSIRIKNVELPIGDHYRPDFLKRIYIS